MILRPSSFSGRVAPIEEDTAGRSSSKEDLAGMARVGRLVGEAIREMKAAARPGMTTAELGGYIADAAVTVVLPPVSPTARKLRKCVRAAFEQGLSAARPGNRVSEIGRRVDQEVRRHGFSVLRNLCGHGVGRTIHEAPSVPNFYDPRARDVLKEGMVIALEPMISAEPARTVQEPDGWTIRTHNRSLAAHYEHTVVISRGQPLVLTAA